MAFLERLASAYGDDWWFQSALAFTYHEVDRYEDSRRLSERSLQQYSRQRRRRHNLAHIYFETLDTRRRRQFLADWLAGYDHQRVVSPPPGLAPGDVRAAPRSRYARALGDLRSRHRRGQAQPAWP